MWITFKNEYQDDKGVIRVPTKINLNKIEHIILYEERIELYPATEDNFYGIYKYLNENFEEIKKKLMEL
ncbi:hypothetical protein [Fusobacterium varium]|uniref:hypothetical protein n=1 Tax=Fusobacterium varium TaxID=856 RepID=UPI0030CA7742